VSPALPQSALIDPIDLALHALPPELEGLRVAHLTDLHITRPRRRLLRVSSQLACMRLDLVLWTGDYMTHFKPGGHTASVMRRLCDEIRPRFGMFGVFGNHDEIEIRRSLERLPITWLDNQRHPHHELPIDLVGLAAGLGRFPDTLRLLESQADAPQTQPDPTRRAASGPQSPKRHAPPAPSVGPSFEQDRTPASEPDASAGPDAQQSAGADASGSPAASASPSPGEASIRREHARQADPTKKTSDRNATNASAADPPRDPAGPSLRHARSATGRSTTDRFQMMLCHWPTYLPVASELGADLMFSGHTHGGQIRLPNRWCLRNSTDMPSRLTSGVLRHRQTVCLVARGLGEVGLPLRLFCPPHVPVYNLHRGPPPGRNVQTIENVRPW